MPVKDYNADPDLNTQISGINIAEGCAPSGINNAIRQLMADVKEEFESEEGAVSSLDSTLRALIAEEVGDAESAASQQVAGLDATLRALIANEKTYLEASIQQSVPVGSVLAFAANNDLNGYLLCNGAAVSRTTYAALFSAIGTTYGAGNGSSTFALPNLTDKFIQGSGTAGTVKSAGLPDLHGEIWRSYVSTATGTSGVFSQSNDASSGSLSSGSSKAYALFFNASKYNAIYGASDTVQPPALTMRYYIKY